MDQCSLGEAMEPANPHLVEVPSCMSRRSSHVLCAAAPCVGDKIPWSPGVQAEQHDLARTIRVSGSILLSTVSNFLDFFKMGQLI